ncbi:unnamed protein product [Phaedon cochleariae]|uniref:[histone H3]-dimethyl-L-lysine(9) demethylase n=1 Tax=Phaedon cochleariae TaxID=80249 RepID=A0A9P0GRT1_PHACE|nr:unnamed protein product [Phaedon cochleariae]
MDLGGVGGILLNQINDPSSSLYHLHQRFQPEDSRSDSGVSSLRSGSGDERSGSRSSALSCPDDGPSLPPQVVATPPHSSSSSSSSSNCSTSSLSAQSHNRSPLFIPASPSALSSRHHLQHEQQGGASSGSEPVRVWRDPNLLLEEPHVRHVHSVQHQASLFQTLLMSHSSSPSSGGASSGGGAGGPPPTSSSAASMGVYPVAPPPPPSLIGPPHVPHHPHLGHAPLYHPAQFSADMLWKATNRASPYGVPAHLLNATAASVGQQQGQGHAGAEEMMAERERAAMAMQDRDRQERMFRERQNQEMAEKQQKEKERMEREKQEHKEKIERERQEKELELALHNHFEKSLRAVHQKREQWNPTTNRPPQSRTSSLSEDDRKRVEEIHHREQQRHMTVRDSKDHRGYYGAVQRPASVPGKTEYPPPPAHSRVGGPACKPAPDKMASHGVPQQQQAGQPSKNEMQHVYGYASVQQQQNAYFEPKMKTEMHKSGQQQQQQGGGGLVVTKSMDRGDGGAMVGEMKNSVIVKHDTKNPHHLDQPRVSMAHSPSPKLRNEMMGHYQSQTGQNKGMYEYRSPTQSPHHLAHVAPTSHHQHQVEAQNMAKVQLQQQQQQQHRPQPQTSSPHQLQQRHSPHPQQQQQHLQQQQQHLQQQQHHANEMRYRSGAEAQAMVYHAAKTNYPYTTSTYTMSTMSATPTAPPNAKSKVSSPAPHQIFGKPPLGGVSVVPVTRPLVHHDLSGATGATPVQLTANKPVPSISSSPYQQVSQYHLPHNAAPSQLTCPPPPAHSSRASTTSGLLMDRYAPPAGLSVKLVGVGVAGTSPPTATSAPLAGVGVGGGGGGGRGHGGFAQSLVAGQQVQTQPLDLGVSSAKFENHPSSPKRKSSTPISQLGVGANPGSPVCLEVKKRRIDTPPATTQFVSVSAHSASVSAHNPPQLARVSEPSPLIASAATTITTVVNAAVAFRTTPPTALISRQTPPPEVGGVVELVGGRPESTSPKPATPTATAPLGGSPAPLSAATTPTLSVTPQPAEESPGTPAKVNPSVLDSEKSNSPGPQKNPSSASYPVRHLKKAWLQRHTGEDVEDTTGVVGSGSCLTLPLNIKADLGATGAAGATGATPTAAAATNANAATVTKENPVNSIHSIGSMAVNSINKTKHFSSKAANRKAAKEATVNGDAKNDDSSSSDQERGRKSPPKRKPPKVKRKKGGTSAKKAVEEKKRKSGPQKLQSVAVASESGSDSDKESGSEKDSDSGASASAPTKKSAGTGKEQRKRGRKPKGGSKNDKGEEPRPKKSKDDAPPPPRDPSRKPPVGQLKKTGESFLQYGTCFEVAPKLAKCRECRWTVNQRSKNVPNIFCRFYAFRRLRYTKNGQLAIAGFSDPHKDALEEDLKLWLPNADHPPADLDLETSRFLLKQVADHFCDLFLQEKEANTEHMSEDKTVAWKRVVQGVREMCDVCETTLFNCHWACGKCGFVVCIDCYKSRKKGAMKMWGEPGKDRDEFSWLLCTNRQAHEQEKLMLTQIIAGDSLNKLGRMVHETRELWNIEQFCGCPMIKEFTQKTNNLHAKEIVRSILGDKVNGVKKEIKDEDDTRSQDGEEKKKPPLGSSSEEDEDEGEGGNFSTLRELLIRPSHKPNGSSSSRAGSPVVAAAAASASSKGAETRKKLPAPTKPADLDDVISSVIEDSVPQKVEAPSEPKHELKHFIRRYNWAGKGRVQLPIRIMTLTESKMLYPDTPHSWLCDGKLLRLSDPLCKANYKIFQDQWKRGQPVIVSDVTRNADPDLWHPEAFARDFGDEKNDLVNCMTGNLVPNQPMRKFWEGFDHFSKRLKDDRGQSMLLKLKDWPPGEDFAEIMPSRYADLMKVLPLAEYTHRTGRLNLASRLPECFVRPDLGPKMYNAYGSALHPNKGTTNLHLDISDAVNVMVYVGIPKDGDTDEHIKEAFRAIDEAGCDILTRRRVRDKGELPGALWHIYNARDADKIRDLLNKVVVEKGGRLEPHHDPIHDQSCYLDGPLRERLYKEYGVEGYAIVQCKGDAVFIPAGAPHQVRNLHNCIKVAEDFVSPENVSHCFHLTQEFRDLTDTHSNHEDKLQIKNIIYHAVKDALSALEAVIERHDAENAAAKSSDDGSATTTSNDGDNSGKSDSNEGV